MFVIKNVMRVLIIIVSIFCLQQSFKAQISNGGMETYTITNNDTLPTGWKADSYFSTIPGKTNDAHSGSWAFIINTWYYYGVGMLVNGNLTAGNLLFDWVKSGAPITTKPTYLNGFYKYTDVVNGDSALVQVLLKKWNSSSNKIDTIGYGISKLPTTASYTNFSVAINDYSIGVQPDSVVIFFMSFDYLKNIAGPGFQPPCQNNYCRYLYIDDLTLSTINAIKENKDENKILLFYENNELNVINNKSKNIIIEIYSIEGKALMKKELSETKNKIDLSDLRKGVYIVKIPGEIYSNYKFLKE